MKITFGLMFKTGFALALGWELGRTAPLILSKVLDAKGRERIKTQYYRGKTAAEQKEKNLRVVRQWNNKSETPTTGA